jgi:hypothetical protein
MAKLLPNTSIGITPIIGGATNPILSMLGSDNNYIQSYIYNSSNTANASADVVCYPNNGVDSSGWIDMGITSNAFSQATYSVTGRNEGYIFMSAPAGSGTSGNLIIATDSTGQYNTIEFYVGGFNMTKGTADVSITTQGIANTRIVPRVVSVTSTATANVDSNITDQYELTALAAASAISVTGSPVDGQKLVIRLKDNGVARALTWNTSTGAFRTIGTTLPTTTTVSKVSYIGTIYNSQDNYWDVVAVATQA